MLQRLLLAISRRDSTESAYGEHKRNGLRGAQSKGCCQVLHMRGAPVWTQYIAIFTVHDDPNNNNNMCCCDDPKQ